MNEDCEHDHPADIVLECRQHGPPIGFTAMQDYLLRRYCTDRYVEAKGHGIGTSTISQADADQQALEKAIEHADTKIKVKVRCLVKLAKWMGFDMYPRINVPTLVNERFDLIAPKQAGWQGQIDKKPWEYRVMAAIPHLDTIEPLKVCIELLRKQTVRPYILVVDTGSPKRVRDELEDMREEDLEITFLASHAYQHASEPVAVALDIAQALCRSEYIFHTHADCFLNRDDFLEDISRICTPINPVVGYRMSPREWVTDEWKWMVGHTATLCHMDTMNRIGAMWNMHRARQEYGYRLDGMCGNWPDTETGFNRILREHGIKPYFIGDDENGKRQIDRNIDHVRSYACSSLYSAEYHGKARTWMTDAISDARKRLVNETV